MWLPHGSSTLTWQHIERGDIKHYNVRKHQIIATATIAMVVAPCAETRIGNVMAAWIEVSVWLIIDTTQEAQGLRKPITLLVVLKS
jgi:hypothetical protein